ncbi:MAG TPA: hypothetical protein VGD02_04400 [Gemmatimonadaceae bacterium]
MSQGLDFFLGGDVEIDLCRWSGRRFWLLLALRLPAPGASSGISRFYLMFEGASSACVDGATTVEAVPGAGGGTERKNDGEKEKGFSFTGGRHVGRL